MASGTGGLASSHHRRAAGGRGVDACALPGRTTNPATPPGARRRRDELAAFTGNTLAFQREPGFVCVVNLNKRPITYPTDQRVLCASGPVEPTDAGLVVPADTAAWLSTDG